MTERLSAEQTLKIALAYIHETKETAVEGEGDAGGRGYHSCLEDIERLLDPGHEPDLTGVPN